MDLVERSILQGSGCESMPGGRDPSRVRIPARPAGVRRDHAGDQRRAADLPLGYEANMRSVLETTSAMGVVPILSSIPALDRSSVSGRVEALNTILYNLALEYQIPFVDYWSALVSLPNRGLTSHGVPPSGGPASADFSPAHPAY